MDDELIDQGNAFSVGESCLDLVFKGEVIEEFEDECSEARSLKNFNKFWNVTLLLHLNPYFFVKG
jgi:hypothetical protein